MAQIEVRVVPRHLMGWQVIAKSKALNNERLAQLGGDVDFRGFADRFPAADAFGSARRPTSER